MQQSNLGTKLKNAKFYHNQEHITCPDFYPTGPPTLELHDVGRVIHQEIFHRGG